MKLNGWQFVAVLAVVLAFLIAVLVIGGLYAFSDALLFVFFGSSVLIARSKRDAT